MLGEDVERQPLAFAEGLREGLERKRDDRPVVRAPEVDLTDLAEEDQALDRGGEPVRHRGG